MDWFEFVTKFVTVTYGFSHCKVSMMRWLYLGLEHYNRALGDKHMESFDTIVMRTSL